MFDEQDSHTPPPGYDFELSVRLARPVPTVKVKLVNHTARPHRLTPPLFLDNIEATKRGPGSVNNGVKWLISVANPVVRKENGHVDCRPEGRSTAHPACAPVPKGAETAAVPRFNL